MQAGGVTTFPPCERSREHGWSREFRARGESRPCSTVACTHRGCSRSGSSKIGSKSRRARLQQRATSGCIQLSSRNSCSARRGGGNGWYIRTARTSALREAHTRCEHELKRCNQFTLESIQFGCKILLQFQFQTLHALINGWFDRRCTVGLIAIIAISVCDTASLEVEACTGGASSSHGSSLWPRE